MGTHICINSTTIMSNTMSINSYLNLNKVEQMSAINCSILITSITMEKFKDLYTPKVKLEIKHIDIGVSGGNNTDERK
jgi:hypothetical protein